MHALTMLFLFFLACSNYSDLLSVSCANANECSAIFLLHLAHQAQTHHGHLKVLDKL